MDRIIKFRAKRLDNGEWVYGDLLCSIMRCCIVNYIEIKEGVSHSNYYDIDPNTVGQFTGLHDRNGKEIYDGDILVSEGVVVDYLEVFWSDSRAAFLIEDYNEDKQTTGNCDYLSVYDTMFYTICGNIHDNPDFFK